MKRTSFLARLSLLLVLVLLVAAAFAGCGEKDDTAAADVSVTTAASEREVIGEGKYSFDFNAIAGNGERFEYAIRTDSETVGEALIALGLIAGDNGPYGLYVKSVCGVIADYDVSKTYWALYTDGEMSMTGVESVKCADVSLVEFKVTE